VVIRLDPRGGTPIRRRDSRGGRERNHSADCADGSGVVDRRGWRGGKLNSAPSCSDGSSVVVRGGWGKEGRAPDGIHSMNGVDGSDVVVRNS